DPGRTASGNASPALGWGYQQNSYTVPSVYAYVKFYAEIYYHSTAADAYFDDAILSGGFLYTSNSPPPTVSSISPNSGTYNGGTGVTITGTGFLSGAMVTFGGTPATSVTVVSSTS